MRRYLRHFVWMLFGGAVASLPAGAQADVKLPSIISDHMVLQRDMADPIWGWADQGEQVTVSIAGQSKTATPDASGRWMVKLDPLKVGDTTTLTVAGKNTITIKDVLVGEVWLGSGQSNMAMGVSRAKDFDKEQAAAKYPQIRMFLVANKAASEPQADCEGQWVVCAPDTVGQFSATAYFFGRELHKSLGVPVGLVRSCVGGTPIESWISADAQRSSPELKEYIAAQEKTAAEFNVEAAKKNFERQKERWKEAVKKAKAAGETPPRAPRDPIATRERKGNTGGLFNGMIAPLIPYAIRGMIWYQGEANAQPNKAQFYQYQLPLLVKDWRTRWGEGDFPAAWVQLPNFNRAGDYWSIVREGMLKSLATPHTGMAIAIDVGDPKDIHPANKQAVGARLAMWALGDVYGQKVATSGPLPAGHEVRGREIVVSFSHTDSGLQAKGDALRGFQIAGADKVWHAATAQISGDKVIVSSAEVSQPVAVRYAWAPNPDCNLYNGAGLPASPFRTDDWSEETKE